MNPKTETILAADAQALSRAAAVLRTGGVVALPTDTVYGIAADIWQECAIERLFEIKGRSSLKSIAVLVADREQARELTLEVTRPVSVLIEAFWPGPLTLILPRRPSLPAVLSPHPTIGLRMPNQAFTLELLKMHGPLAVTSANLSGQADCVSPDQVLAQLDGRFELLVDGGICPGQQPSTVVDCTTPSLDILREGPLTRAMIAAALSAANLPG